RSVYITYYIAKVALAGAGNVNNLEVTIGTDVTVEAQTTVLGTFNDYSETNYMQQVHTFTAPADGVYYLGFNYTAPAHVANDFGGILLDAVSVTTDMGLNDFLGAGLAIYPNPASDMLTVSSQGSLIDGIEIVDLNGRVVKTLAYPGTAEVQVDIAA